MNFTTLSIEGKQYVLVPMPEMQKILRSSEMSSDVAAYNNAMQEFKKSGAKALPLALTKRIIKGEHPVRVYREFRNMTHAALAEKAGISSQYIHLIEAGKRKGSIVTLEKIADALGITLEELL